MADIKTRILTALESGPLDIRGLYFKVPGDVWVTLHDLIRENKVSVSMGIYAKVEK